MIVYYLLYRKGLHSPVKKFVAENGVDADFQLQKCLDFADAVKRMYPDRTIEHILFTFKFEKKHKPEKFIDAEYRIL